MIVDGIWSSVGSTNFDNRSFRLNDEANLNLHDTQIATALREQFMRDRELSNEMPAVLERLAGAGGFPSGLAAAGATRDDLDVLTAQAATQWTGTFNPRPFDAQGAREIFEMAW